MANELAIVSAFLIIVYVFILFTLRAIYFTFVVKQDPIKAVTPYVIRQMRAKQSIDEALKRA